MENKVFNWCFIGAGKLAHRVANSILPSGRHKITSVYTRSFEKGKAFAEKFGGTAYETAKEAITAPDVDGVYVVTTHDCHYEYVKLALQLGKPVLCEKAFTITADEARELVALAKEKDLYLAEAMWTWFGTTAHKVKEWLDNGEFGELEEVSLTYNMNSQKYAERVTDPNRAGGALLDVGVYPITYMYRLFGKPTKVVCSGVLENGIDLCEKVDLTFENGKTYSCTASICDFKGLETLKIKGSKAKIKFMFYHFMNKVKLVRKKGKNEVFNGNGGYLREFDVAASEIREGLKESRLVPLDATVDVMEIMDECRRQMGLVYPFEKAGK